MYQKQKDSSGLPKWFNARKMAVTVALFVLACIIVVLVFGPGNVASYFKIKDRKPKEVTSFASTYWEAPDSLAIPLGSAGDEIRYGRELIASTAKYLGPKGKVSAISNGMNCQNCHLKAGTKIFGNNYSAVASTYPKFRARSGTIESIEKRVNDCVERSLNGKALPYDSREMQAMVSYIKWVGTNVPKNETPKGAGLLALEYLEEPADPVQGKLLYAEKCSVCHGKNGEGVANADSVTWTYPPLWGLKSYNDGAGLYRLSRFAGYVKANMPLGATFDQPKLSDAECWHLAAYVNSLERPELDKSKDWPDISKKPVDYPFGPYVDGFTENLHKYGPFKPIVAKRQEWIGGK